MRRIWADLAITLLGPNAGSITFFHRDLQSVSDLIQFVLSSVTRLGDFFHFRQPFKSGVNNYFTQIAHIVREFL